MVEYWEECEDVLQCPDGGHDFEPLPVEGGWGIVIGESRCRTCGALADEIKVDGPVLAASGNAADSGATGGQDAAEMRARLCQHLSEESESRSRG